MNKYPRNPELEHKTHFNKSEALQCFQGAPGGYGDQVYGTTREPLTNLSDFATINVLRCRAI